MVVGLKVLFCIFFTIQKIAFFCIVFYIHFDGFEPESKSGLGNFLKKVLDKPIGV